MTKPLVSKRFYSGLLSAAVCLFCGCDPHYRLHLVTTVTTSSIPVEGAWVSQLVPGPESNCQTDSKGVASCGFGGFLRNTSREPVLVCEEGMRLFVAVPGRDFALDGRGCFMVTEWDAQLVAELEPLPSTPGIAPRCDESGRCDLILPRGPRDHCTALLVACGTGGISVSQLAKVEVAPAGHGADLISFDVEGQSVEHSTRYQVVWSCFSDSEKAGPDTSQARYVVVSDPIEL